MQTLDAGFIIAQRREPRDAPFVIQTGPGHITPVAVDVVQEAFFRVPGAETVFDVQDAGVVFEEIHGRSHDPKTTVDPMPAEILIVYGWGI